MISHLYTHLICFLVSPYLKSLSMVAANKLLHLLEVIMHCFLIISLITSKIICKGMSSNTKLLILQAFSTPWFLFSNATNHHLVFFLLEIFNNIIQYQFDGKKPNCCFKVNMFDRLIHFPRGGGVGG